MQGIIGRTSETRLLSEILISKQAELAVIYGRRRVGKTYLIRTFFSEKSIFIEFTGIQNGNLSRQLQSFSEQLSAALFNHIPLKVPTTWHEAFTFLNNEINKIPESNNIVIFFDELPWMVTKRSGLLQELDHFWNTRWSLKPNIKIILCGSAASWMIENIINATGGLHNRITRRILLNPFDLSTTKQYLSSLGFKYTTRQIIELYMMIGGIPFYLNNLSKNLSLQQNIEALCFEKEGILYDEFVRLFESLYEYAEMNLKIIRTIAKYREGMSRSALIEALQISSGGSLNTRIKELESAGFIQTFIPYGREVRNVFYRVIDPYCLFYLKWIEPIHGREVLKGYWHTKHDTSAWHEWAGYSFENICFKHAEYIRSALGLQHIACEIASWKHFPKRGEKSDGAQIDLLFDRDDGVITLCEIKFSDKPYSITKDYAKSLARKLDVFQSQTKTPKQLMLAMITAGGFKENLWSEDLVQSVVTVESLFNK